MLISNHKRWMTGHPQCAMGQWMDNHLGVDPGHFNDPAPSYEGFLAYLIKQAAAGKLFYECSDFGPGVHRVTDPTGWGIELNVQQNTTMASSFR